jgi:nucleolar protein 53
LPASGQSYNPSYESHQELLRKAHEVEAQRVREEERVREIKERMAKARKDGKEMGGVEMEGGEYAEGMRVEILEEDEEMEAPVEEEMVGEDGEELTEAQKQEKREQARQPNRRTQAQRNKADKVAAEVSFLSLSLSLSRPTLLLTLFVF